MKSFLTATLNDGCVCLFVDPFSGVGWKLIPTGEFKIICPHGLNFIISNVKKDLSNVNVEKLDEVKNYINMKLESNTTMTEKQIYENLLSVILSIEEAIKGGVSRNHEATSTVSP